MLTLPSKIDPVLSVAGSLCLLLCVGLVCGERDFNFNESQVPLLEPKDEPARVRYHQDPYATEAARCQNTDSKIILSLVLKSHDWHDLSDNKQANVLDKLSKFFAIPKEFIQFESVTKNEIYEMQKEAIRKGNNKCHTKRLLGRVNLMLGCGDAYFTVTEPIVRQIGAQMKDGSINNISGEKFGWWIIWRKRIKNRTHRLRRQIESSAEVDDYEYEYDDDEEENTETVTEVPAVTTHAHRHHHGVSEPELTDSKIELTNNIPEPAFVPDSDRDIVPTAVPGIENSNSDVLDVPDHIKSHDTNLLQLNKDVSQLESVITKTIENTKNIKELPVVVDDTEVLEENVGGEVPEVPEIEKDLEAPVGVLEELNNELERKAEGGQAMGSFNQNLIAPNGSPTDGGNGNVATLGVATPATPGIADFEEVIEPEGIDGSLTIDSIGDRNVQAPFNRNEFDADNGNANSLPSSVNMAEVVASTTPPPTVTVELEPLTSSTNATLVLANTPSSPVISTIKTATSILKASTPQSPSSLPELTPMSGVGSDNAQSFLSHTPIPSSPSLLSSASSSSSSLLPSTHYASASSSLSSSTTASILPSTTTTTVTVTATPTSTPTIQTKDDNESVDNRNATVIVAPPSSTDVYGRYLPPTVPALGASTTSASPPSQLTTTPIAPSSALPETTPSTLYTDYVEPRVDNTPPMIKTRLQKFGITSGKYFAYTIPMETFYDAEDQTGLRLALTDKTGHELKPNSWLQFNSGTREIYGLPLDIDTFKWEYRLTATDSGNESVTETVDIMVQQHRLIRSVNHEINIAVKINEKPARNVDWQLKLMRAIAETLGDDSTSAIFALEIRQNLKDVNAATFVYFNETLPTSECPETKLHDLIKRLDASRLNDLVYPMLSIKSITGQLTGPCQKTQIAKPKPTTHMTKNTPPMLRNQLDRVNATVGHLLVFKVPSDTFYDAQDAELTLTLKTKDHKELSPRHWLQFDSKNQEFYGVPKSGDIGSEEYLLIAEDSGGLKSTDALVVVVNHAPKREFSVFFKAYLAIRHEQFNADLQRKFVERVSQLFGDSTTQYIQIRSVTTQHDSDSTIVNFYNTTLYKIHNRCPEEEIEATRSVFLMQHSILRDRVKKVLGPELNLTQVQVSPLSSCHPQTGDTHREFIPTKTDEPRLKSAFSDNYMFTYIVPAILIVSMVLIAVIIACCLHRRRRKSGKMELGDEEERKSFRTKGIPVIFQDEMEEKPEIGNKSPIILKDEKPPLLPPSYNTSNMNGDNDVDEYVPPPAVVVGGREARGKSPATPSYRKPPPYVSP